MLLVQSSLTNLNPLISFGKIQPLFKMQHTTMVKKVELSRCLAGHTLMSKLSVKHLAKWAGWELKSSPLKNPWLRMNGLKTESWIHGISTINQFLTTWMVEAVTVMHSAVWSQLVVPMVCVFTLMQLSTICLVVVTIFKTIETVAVPALNGLVRRVKLAPLTLHTIGLMSITKILVWFLVVSIPLLL
jgi:hypothetical protein